MTKITIDTAKQNLIKEKVIMYQGAKIEGGGMHRDYLILRFHQ